MLVSFPCTHTHIQGDNVGSTTPDEEEEEEKNVQRKANKNKNIPHIAHVRSWMFQSLSARSLHTQTVGATERVSEHTVYGTPYTPVYDGIYYTHRQTHTRRRARDLYVYIHYERQKRNRE